LKTKDIQKELKKRGITQKQIAQLCDVSEMLISKVIHKNTVSKRIMNEISHAINRDCHYVFPDYFKQRKNIT